MGHSYYKLLIFLASAAVVLMLPAIVMSATTQTETTVSNATVQASIAISLSANLTAPERINFGTIDPGTDNYNATHNNDSSGGNTSMWVLVSQDSNVNVDLCINANESMKAGSYEIELGNYTYNGSIQNSTRVWANNTQLPGTVMPADPSWDKVEQTIPTSSDQYVYFRFWLDAPTGQQVGEYVNEIRFKAVQATYSC